MIFITPGSESGWWASTWKGTSIAGLAWAHCPLQAAYISLAIARGGREKGYEARKRCVRDDAASRSKPIGAVAAT